MRILIRQQARRLIEQPDPGCPTGLRNRIVLRLMYEAGLRVSEVVALRRQDVDLEQGTVLAGEGQTQRSVPLLAQALEELRRWLRQHPGGPWLAPTLAGRQISDDYLREMVSREAAAAGLDPAAVSPRVLRDTCGLELSAQFTTEEIAMLLGFADRRSAAKYRRAAAPGIAERMRARELQPELPERPDPRELLEQMLADPATRRQLARALIEELGEEIREAADEQAAERRRAMTTAREGRA